MRSVALHTLGCKVNQCDGDVLLAALNAAGYATNRQPPVDICIINTCTVTHTVDRKSMQMIRRARRANPGAFVAACGCGVAKIKADASHPLGSIAEPGVGGADYTFDARRPGDLLAELAKRFPPHEGTKPQGAMPCDVSPPAAKEGRTRAFLKVQDGCDRFCAYCIVPYARGGPTSLPMAEVLRKATESVERGAKEIVLTGIQLAAYGKDNGEANLPRLIRRVAAIPGLRHLRLSSLDPWAVDDRFLAAVEDAPNLCDHFHLSLQSGCDATLARMNRRYTTAEYEAAVARLLKARPGAALTTDIIVGFPGETADDFDVSHSFARRMGFARIHVFPYSPRKGTAAVNLPDQVPAAVKKERKEIMLATAAQAKQRFLAAQVGKTVEVLLETPTQGHTANYCPVRISSRCVPNTLVRVHITGCDSDGLKGEIP
jgi:threonylcarbamoyladenosine tRNA methylthiotransferase MtaB